MRDATTVPANVDGQEIAHFGALADDWWDPEGPSRTLLEINPCRQAWIAAQVPLAGRRVLDIGCGGGVLTESLAHAGALASGLDASAALIDAARRHAALGGLPISYEATTAEAFASAGHGPFDAITCMELLEHVPDPAPLLAACHALLVPGGDLLLSTLNRTARAFGTAIVLAEHVLRLLPRGTHEYRKFIRPSELARWLRDAGFDVVRLDGMAYDPLARTARLTRDVGVNYLLHARRID